MFAIQPPSPETEFYILLLLVLAGIMGFGYLIDEAFK